MRVVHGHISVGVMYTLVHSKNFSFETLSYLLHASPLFRIEQVNGIPQVLIGTNLMLSSLFQL